MDLLVIVIISLFYIFFFVRAYLLSHKLKKDIKAKDNIVNLSMILAGWSSGLFLLCILKILPLPLVFQSDIFAILGIVFILFGVIIGMVSSLSLKDSWRIWIPTHETTELITSGMYRFSRNPYFSSFAIVLIGMCLYITSLYIILPNLAIIIVFHILILREEKYLEQKHKDTYQKYKRKVWRYLRFIK